MQLAVDSQREGGRISTFHGSPYSDSVITGVFNLTSSGFLAAHNVHTTYFPVFKQMLERLRFLPEWWDCALTMLALRHPLTAALCQCGQSVLVKLVSMANEWNPKTAQTSKKKRQCPISTEYRCAGMLLTLINVSAVYWTARGLSCSFKHTKTSQGYAYFVQTQQTSQYHEPVFAPSHCAMWRRLQGQIAEV